MDGLLLEQSPNWPGQWAVIALGVVTVLYVAVIRPMRKGKRKDPLERPSGQQFSLAQQRAVEREMSNLLVEYEEMLRRMTAQLETRAARLELLINQADERLVRLQALAAATAPASQPQNGAGRSGPPAETAAAAALPESDASESSMERLSPLPSMAETSPHGPVYELADQGRTPRQIAQQLDRPYGEIELILALRPARP